MSEHDNDLQVSALNDWVMAITQLYGTVNQIERMKLGKLSLLEAKDIVRDVLFAELDYVRAKLLSSRDLRHDTNCAIVHLVGGTEEPESWTADEYDTFMLVMSKALTGTAKLPEDLAPELHVELREHHLCCSGCQAKATMRSISVVFHWNKAQVKVGREFSLPLTKKED